MRRVIEIEMKGTSGKVRDMYAEYQHFRLEVPRYRKMMEEAVRVYEEGGSTLRIQAVLCGFDAWEITEDAVILNGVPVRCRAFGKLRAASVKRVYAYFLTAGECTCDREDMMDRLYADVWGTVAVDYGREKLEQVLCREAEQSLAATGVPGLHLSPSYGPGFYGMPQEEVLTLYRLVQPEEIGVSINSKGALRPVKSCTGVYVAADDVSVFPHGACAACQGTELSCGFCRLHNLSEKEERHVSRTVERIETLL